ncbi:hypothetical protein DAPPUDRAFT_272166 [Daphnia pulex]|uniref:Acyl-CoA dehydrogenase/oxidase N-terminal domain-containing protein n=1 Tax=Daphnia pulex TaxID=6669 RepID=E9I2T6_DAPPU|nr:hypothetical protein DAPPUDRAFT_272166 [Daphnia pulex]|eukprot:EFX61694.1 hypothetical protein DAPPUDRAFT_272166 [Daphnia pulex]
MAQLIKSMAGPVTLRRSFLLINMNFSAKSPQQSAGYCFELTPEQLEIQQLARQFSLSEIIPVAAHHDRTGEYPWDIIKKAHGLGLMNHHIPEEFEWILHSLPLLPQPKSIPNRKIVKWQST